GRKIGDGETGSFGIADAVRNLAQGGGGNLNLLGIATKPAADDAFAHVYVGDRASDRDDVAGRLAARRVGQSRLVLVLALHRQDVGKVHRGGADAHARLMRLQLRKFDVLQS